MVETLHEEIGERQKAEEKTLRLNRLYVVLTETNQAIVRAVDREALFRDFCRVAVEHGGFKLAWVGLVDEEKQVRVAASAGVTSYLDDIRISKKEEPAGLGPIGIAIRKETYYTCNDFLGSEITRPWHERGRAHGIRASASIALKQEGRVIGALTLYAAEKDFFDEQQVGLLRQMGADVSFALDNLEREARRRAAEEALLQSQKMETVGRLAGGIAHDFNNHLMVMSGFAEQAQETCREPAAREALQYIISAGSRAKELTRKLLTFSRQQVMQKRRIDLGAVLEELLRLLKRVIGVNIEVMISLPEGPLTVDADPVQIEQILINIVLNARDAMPEGGRLRLSLYRTKLEEWEAAAIGISKGDYALIDINDTGVGIPPTDLGRIFEPFFSTKEMGKGTGLGLSIAYGIVRQHDGAITAVSSPGNGSTFTIYLPLVEEAPDPVAKTYPKTAPKGEARLLLVEDDTAVRDFLKLVLELEGYTVIEAGDGEEALLLAEKEEFDLLVTDLMMPKMNGVDLHAALTERKPGLNSVLMSGYSSDIMQDRLPEGVVFLQKPVTKSVLLGAIGTLLSGSP